jgi:hypothetical protein
MEILEADILKTRGFMRDLEEAETIYRRLIGLTRNQSRILQGGVSPELLDLARSKEEEMARLSELEARMGPARMAWAQIRDRISGELRSEVQAVVGRVEEVLLELLRLEEEEGQALTVKRDETIAQIRRLDSARKVRNAYSSRPPPSSLLDQKE